MPFEKENLGALAGAAEVNVENNITDDRRISSTFQVDFLKWVHGIAMDVSMSPQAARVAAQIAVKSRHEMGGIIAPKLPEMAATLRLGVGSVRVSIQALARADHIDFTLRRGSGRACLIAPRFNWEAEGGRHDC